MAQKNIYSPEFIERACQTHSVLVEALKGLVEGAEENDIARSDIMRGRRALHMAKPEQEKK